MITQQLAEQQPIAKQSGTSARRQVAVPDSGPGLVWAVPVSFALTLAIVIYLSRISF